MDFFPSSYKRKPRMKTAIMSSFVTPSGNTRPKNLPKLVISQEFYLFHLLTARLVLLCLTF